MDFGLDEAGENGDGRGRFRAEVRLKRDRYKRRVYRIRWGMGGFWVNILGCFWGVASRGSGNERGSERGRRGWRGEGREEMKITNGVW